MNKNNIIVTALLFFMILISGCSAKKKVVHTKPKVNTETKNDIPVTVQPELKKEEILLLGRPLFNEYYLFIQPLQQCLKLLP